MLRLDEELLGDTDVLRLEIELAHQRQAHLRRPQVRQRRGRVRVGAAAAVNFGLGDSSFGVMKTQITPTEIG